MARVVVISPLRAPDPDRDHHGVYQRLRLFVQALAVGNTTLEIAHFAPPDEIDDRTAHELAERSSLFWGVHVTIHQLPLDLAQRRPWQTAMSALDLRYRGDFRPFLGRSAITAVRGLIATKPDVVFAHRLPAMELLRHASDIPPVIFDLDDVEHLVKRRAAAVTRRLKGQIRLRFEARALAKAERRATTMARLTFICSDADRGRLADEDFDTSRIAVAPNAVAMPLVRPPLPQCANALYIGNYGHAPNAEAAERLITLIWPQVRAAIPNARLIIAGAQPERIPSFREEPDGVVFTGLVQNLDDIYSQASIVCCPLVNGGGTRLKLIEAASRGLAIAATHVAAEGLALQDRRDILLRDDDVGLAQACIALLTDRTMAEALADSAFRTVSHLYQPARVTALIGTAINQALSSPQATPRPARFPSSKGLADLQTDAVKQ